MTQRTEGLPIIEPRYRVFRICSLFGTGIIVYSYAFLIAGFVHDVPLEVVHIIVIFGLVSNWLFVELTGRVRDGIKLILLNGALVVTSLFIRGGVGDAGFFAPFVYLTFTALLTNYRGVKRWSFLVFVGCLGSVLLDVFGVIDVPYTPLQLSSFFATFFTFVFCSLFFHRALLRYQKEILELDRAKSEFISVASHQLKTPPTALKWYTEILLSGDAGKLTKKQVTVVKELQDIVSGMIATVNALLNVSRIELKTFIVKPVSVKLGEVATSIVQELRADISQKQLVVTESYAKNIPAIRADAGLIRVIFENLLSNAVKYTPEHGTVSVSMSRMDERVLITVSDSGYGIPVSEQAKIFKKMFRASNVSNVLGGTGLGLYIVKGIVDFVGGKIWFESAEGKGTTFFVSLPITGMKEKGGTSRIT